MFANIPHEAIGKEARITVECDNWLKTDTTLVLAKDMTLNIARDPKPYGEIQFLIWDANREKALPGVKASVEGIEGVADSEGRVHLNIPLEKQKSQYTVNCEIPLVDNALTGLPTQENTALIVK